MTAAHPVVSNRARLYYRVLAGVFAALAILDLCVLDLHVPHNISQLVFHLSLPVFFIAIQLDLGNRLRTSLLVLASIALIGNAMFAVAHMLGYFRQVIV